MVYMTIFATPRDGGTPRRKIVSDYPILSPDATDVQEAWKEAYKYCSAAEHDFDAGFGTIYASR